MRTQDELRAALQSLERHAARPEAVLPGAARPRVQRPHRTFRQRRPWARIGGPILVALAVVAAVVTPLAVGKILKSDQLNGPADPAGANPTAAQVLNATAQVAAAQPAQAPGKYWRVSIASMKLIAAGPNAHPYALRETLSPWSTWYPVHPSNPNQWYIAYSDAGYTTTPATPGAAAQWRADGSPALASAKLPVIRTEAFSDLRFGPNRMTPAQFESLPSDPARLKADIEQMVKDYSDPGVKYPHSLEVFGIITDLLDHEPITPQVRAAAFRILAGLPGIEMLGKVTDPVGRPGYMIGLDGGASKNFGEVRMLGGSITLVISPSTGTLLAEESVATSQSSFGKSPPASGAIPGATACGALKFSSTPEVNSGADSHPYTHDGRTYCVPRGATVKVLPSGDGISDFVAWTMPRQAGVASRDPLGPVVAVQPGTVTGAYVILGAGWTNATPVPGA